MNPRACFKYLLLIIGFVCSCVFMMVTNKLSDLGLVGIFGGILLSFNILVFNKKSSVKKNKKIFKILLLGLTILDVLIWGYYVYLVVSEFINFGIIDFRPSYIYFTVFCVMVVNDFSDMWNRSNILYDILVMIVTIIVIFVHYRYYIDGRLLHNLFGIRDINSVILQNSYVYVTQYYWLFSVMYIVLIINKKLNNSFSKL